MNQVACSTLGFSPHQLVFGKNLRSEIDELRDRFLGLTTNDCQRLRQVTEFMLDLQKRLKTANELAKQNAAKQQQKTCIWYDMNAKPKVFEPGDYCLVLVADDSRKLFARWSEPAEVIRRVSETSYEISLNNQRVIKHVNCLRPFSPRQPPGAIVAAVVSEDADSLLPDKSLPLIDWCGEQPTVDSDLRIGTHLNADQQSEMRKLLSSFPDVFSTKLGRTDVLKHKIELDDYKPCVSRPYRLPQSVENQVQKEINRLLEAGVIRESLSDFCSPMVPVKKKDSDEIRITVNFSRLNAKMKDIAFPMTNPMTLLGKVAGKKRVSSVDMRQRFFQIELEESSKKFTAFWSGNSSYEFNRSAMGLKTSPAILQKLMGGPPETHRYSSTAFSRSLSHA